MELKLLARIFLGNPLEKWLIAVAVAVGVYLVFFALKSVSCHRLAALAGKTKTVLGDIILAMARKTKPLFFLIISAYTGSLFLTLSHSARVLAGKITGLTALLQVGVWGTAGLSVWFERKISGEDAEQRARAATVKLLNFISRAALWTFVLLLVLDNLGVKITTLVAGLGIGGVAIALALQNILSDLLGFISIILDKPFVVGDFIAIDEFQGTVENIGLKTTRIRSLFGEQLVFANNDLLKGRIKNYGRMKERRVVFGLDVVYETPYEKLVRIPDIIKDVIENQKQVRFERCHFAKYGASALSYEIVYWVLGSEYNVYMDIQQAINLDIFRRFQAEGIEFAYPTQRVLVEGNEG